MLNKRKKRSDNHIKGQNMTMKYVIYQNCEGEVPVFFPNYISHKRLCVAIEEDRIVSAGFVRMNSKGKLECYGRSVTLKLKSREKHDSILVNHYLSLNPNSI